MKDFGRSYKRLTGFDLEGDVFTFEDRIFRGIFKGKGILWERIFKICEKNNLFRHSIVKTKIITEPLFPKLSYDLIFEHEKIPFISYPHEWPVEMLKEAAIFHIDLSLALAQFGLMLKDFHPLNILFNNSRPVFVDFTSIIFADKLVNEDYLKPMKNRFPFKFLWNTNSKYFYEMYRIMFAPYFLFPLYLMKRGKFKETRLRMLESTLNASGSPCLREKELHAQLCKREQITYRFAKLLKMLSLVTYGNTNNLFLKTLKREIKNLSPILGESNWTNYYKAKNEDFDFEPSPRWTPKNWVVYKFIKEFNPKTVLDVACNTGWFSIMASKLGCQVVAFDNNEACINLLYHRIKNEKLSILPLMIDFTAPTEDRFASAKDEVAERRQINDKYPLILAASRRLKCEMVMALGIIHHLVFLQNVTFRQITEMLNMFCERYLLLEFISISDKLIQAPEDYYFVRNNPKKFDWYTQKNLIRELKIYFNKIEIKRGFPETRTILICTK